MSMEFPSYNMTGVYNIQKSDFENIKRSLGTNLVRIDLALSLLFPTFNVQQPDQSYLATMDKIANWCQELNMYVLFDLHGYYNNGGAPRDFWDSPGLGVRQPYKSMIANFWIFIAQRYNSNHAVFGFDLYNEPWNALAYNGTAESSRPYIAEWRSQVEEWIDAISPVNPSLIFFVENAGHSYWGKDDWRWVETEPINRPNVVYSPHFYPESTSGTWNSYSYIELPGTHFGYDYSTHNYAAAKAEMAELLNQLYSFGNQHPVFIGEFSAINDEAGLQFLSDFLQYSNQNGWSWAAWTWCGRDQPGFYMIYPDWITLTPQGQIVSRFANS
jgi:aryl-phospho-beta-D-glucosidase BglC (GH1 family)